MWEKLTGFSFFTYIIALFLCQKNKIISLLQKLVGLIISCEMKSFLDFINDCFNLTIQKKNRSGRRVELFFQSFQVSLRLLHRSLQVHQGFVVGWDIARTLTYLGNVALTLGEIDEARRAGGRATPAG